MSTIKQAIETQINDVALSFIRPFINYVTDNLDLFKDDPDVDRISSKMIKELKLETKSDTKNKISDALKGMGASKSGSTKSKSKNSKKEELWLTKDEFLELVENNPDEDYCSYTPPRGKNKNLFCGKVADSKNSENTRDNSFYRCESCKEKVGRGKKLLAGDDSAPSKSIKRNPVPGITNRKSSRPTNGKNKKQEESESDEGSEDSSSESGESLELTPNKSLTKLLNKNHCIYNLTGIGSCLVVLEKDGKNNECAVIYGKFASEVSGSTNITEKMLRELTDVKESKVDKEEASNFTFKKTSDLNLSKLKKKDEDSHNENTKEDSSEESSKKPKKEESSKKSKKEESNKKPKKEESSEEPPKKPKKEESNKKPKKEESSEEPPKKPKKEESKKSKKEESSEEPPKKPKKEESNKKPKKEESSEEPPKKPKKEESKKSKKEESSEEPPKKPKKEESNKKSKKEESSEEPEKKPKKESSEESTAKIDGEENSKQPPEETEVVIKTKEVVDSQANEPSTVEPVVDNE